MTAGRELSRRSHLLPDTMGTIPRAPACGLSPDQRHLSNHIRFLDRTKELRPEIYLLSLSRLESHRHHLGAAYLLFFIHTRPFFTNQFG